MPESDRKSRAVFLSYAHEDAEIAAAICVTLRDAGVEVWMDQSELQGGDAWDANIRRQIRECTLFVPIISARTQARREAYFRLEWKLADERMHLVAEGTPFIVPVVADTTREQDALVPKSFLSVQWSRLPHGHVPPAFALRIAKLLEPSSPASTAEPAPPQASRARLRRSLGSILRWAVALVMAGVALILFFQRPTPTVFPPPPLAAVIDLPANARLALAATSGFDFPLLALSADGKWLVFVGRKEGRSQLYRRRLDTLVEPEPITGTEGALFAFFGPKLDVVGFLTEERLNRVSINGDDFRTLARVQGAVRAVWGPDGWIYVHEEQGSQKVRRLREDGGPMEDMITLGPGQSFTDLLPGSRYALGTRRPSIHGDFAEMLVFDLRTGAATPLSVAGSDPRWLPTGHILIARGGNLQAFGFDAETRTVRGEPITLIRGVDMDQLFVQTQVAISASGVLAYLPGGDRAVGRVVSVNRREQQTRPIALAAGKYGVMDLSPNDRYLAIHVSDVRDYVTIFDLATGESWKLSGSDGFGWPIWNPDSNSLAMVSVRSVFAQGSEKQERTIRIQAADRTAAVQQTITLHDNYAHDDWHPRERVLSLARFGLGGLSYLRLDDASLSVGPNEPSATRWGTVFSPDGKSVAYSSDESGRTEIWLNSYPPGHARQFSDGGGIEPVWSRNGEIFFRWANEWFATRVSPGDVPAREGSPQRVFTLTDFLDTPGRSYDVSSDGQTLYVLQRATPATDNRIHVISNWLAEVQRLVPVK